MEANVLERQHYSLNQFFDELDRLSVKEGPDAINEVLNILVNIFLSIREGNDSGIDINTYRMEKLSKEITGLVKDKPNKILGILTLSHEILIVGGHIEIVHEIPLKINKFLLKEDCVETCLSVLAWLCGHLDDVNVIENGSSLCKSIVGAICKSNFDVKKSIDLRDNSEKIVGVMNRIFERNPSLENIFIGEIFNNLFLNSYFKSLTKKSDSVLPTTVAGVLNKMNLCIVYNNMVSILKNFSKFLEELQIQSTPLCGKEEETIITTAGSCLFRWLSLPHMTNIGRIILAYCKALVISNRLVPLINILLKELCKLCLLIKLPITRTTALELYMSLQLSFRKNPVFFNKHSKELISLISYLSHVDGPDKESCWNAAQNLIKMVYCLIRLHPQSTLSMSCLLYLPELGPSPPDVELESILERHISIFDSTPILMFDQQYLSTTQFTVKKLRTNSTCGLANLGNTCYMNCIIQCLYACTNFSRAVLQMPSNSGQFATSLQTTFANLLLSKDVFTPKNIVRYCKSIFLPGHQHDCSEFLTQFLDKMSEELLKNGECIVISNFRGCMRSTLTCLECSSQSNKEEHFFSLPVAIAENQQDAPYELSQLIEEHFKQELLEDANMYFCELCKKLVRAEKCQLVVSAPYYLVIILLRFSFDGKAKCKTKNNSIVNVSQFIQLPIATSVTEQGSDRTPLHGSEATKSSKKATYKLKSLTVHSGSSLDSGHYYSLASFASNTGAMPGDEYEDSWCVMDDAVVGCVTQSQFYEMATGSSTQTPYVLFYARHEDIQPPPLSDLDVPLTLKRAVEQSSEQRLTSVPIISRPNNPRDDDEDNLPRSHQNNFRTGPRLIF